MSFLAADPARFSRLFPRLAERPNKSLPRCTGDAGLRLTYGGHPGSNRAAIAANFRRQCAYENFAPGPAYRYVIPTLFGRRFGVLHAPCGTSLFCLGFAALRVTVFLLILFGKYAGKISPDPP